MQQNQKQKNNIKVGDEAAEEAPDQPPDFSGNNDNNNNNQFLQVPQNQKFDTNFNNFGTTDMAQSGQFRREDMDIVLYDQYKENKLVFNIKVYINDQNQIILSYLMEEFKKQGISFDGALISYFDSIQDLYVYCGQDPLDKASVVPYDTIVGNSLEIKLRTKKRNIVEQLMEEQQQKERVDQENDTNNNGYKTSQLNGNSKNRVKERKIGEVVEKVALWRRFYTGFFDENQKFISMPLDQAAQKVGISKKTLDDYLLQIRCGKKYGFDFNKHLEKRIGILRTYVKNAKGHGREDKLK